MCLLQTLRNHFCRFWRDEIATARGFDWRTYSALISGPGSASIPADNGSASERERPACDYAGRPASSVMRLTDFLIGGEPTQAKTPTRSLKLLGLPRPRCETGSARHQPWRTACTPCVGGAMGESGSPAPSHALTFDQSIRRGLASIGRLHLYQLPAMALAGITRPCRSA